MPLCDVYLQSVQGTHKETIIVQSKASNRNSRTVLLYNSCEKVLTHTATGMHENPQDKPTIVSGGILPLAFEHLQSPNTGGDLVTLTHS